MDETLCRYLATKFLFYNLIVATRLLSPASFNKTWSGSWHVLCCKIIKLMYGLNTISVHGIPVYMVYHHDEMSVWKRPFYSSIYAPKFFELQGTYYNPRRACAARVKSVRPSVRLSVCLLPRFLPLRATRRPKSDTNGFSTTLAWF